MVSIKREGIKGNIKEQNGKIKEGELIGILQRDEQGFYVRMFKSRWNNTGLVFDHESFRDESYRIQDRTG